MHRDAGSACGREETSNEEHVDMHRRRKRALSMMKNASREGSFAFACGRPDHRTGLCGVATCSFPVARSRVTYLTGPSQQDRLKRVFGLTLSTSPPLS